MLRIPIIGTFCLRMEAKLLPTRPVPPIAHPQIVARGQHRAGGQAGIGGGSAPRDRVDHRLVE